MSKKKINIILIPSAIAIWIVILLRILNYTGPSDNHPGREIHKEKATTKVSSSDSLELLLDYRDPFVAGTSPFIIKKKSSNGENVFKKPVVISPPQILFKGFIYSGYDKRKVALTLINNKSVLPETNDTVMGIKIIKIYSDSLIIEFQKTLFTIRNTQQSKI